MSRPPAWFREGAPVSPWDESSVEFSYKETEKTYQKREREKKNIEGKKHINMNLPVLAPVVNALVQVC